MKKNANLQNLYFRRCIKSDSLNLNNSKVLLILINFQVSLNLNKQTVAEKNISHMLLALAN